jgi:hypothetical protein
LGYVFWLDELLEDELLEIPLDEDDVAFDMPVPATIL